MSTRRVLACAVFLVGALTIAGTAKALLVPAAGVIATFGTTIGGTVLSSAAALAAGIGSALYSVAISDKSTGAEIMRIPVHPDAAQPTPTGWTPSGTAGADPLPPTSGTIRQCWQASSGTLAVWFGSTCFDTLNALGQAACAAAGGGRTFVSAVSPNINCTTGYSVGSFYTSPSDVCDPGYTHFTSPSRCTLSTPSSVNYPPDNICGLKVAGGVMSYNSRDPDCSNAAAAGATVAADGKTVTVVQPTTKVEVKTNADSSVTTTVWAPSPTDPTKTVVTQVTSSPPTAGTPNKTTQAEQQTVVGTGTPSLNVYPTAPGSQTQVNFPDDYSREATQQTVVTKLSTLHTDITDTTATPPTDPVAKTQSDIEGVFFTSTFTSLIAWRLPSRSVSCPTWSFTVWSTSFTLDAHCTLISANASTIAALMLLLWGVAALFIVLGA